MPTSPISAKHQTFFEKVAEARDAVDLNDDNFVASTPEQVAPVGSATFETPLDLIERLLCMREQLGQLEKQDIIMLQKKCSMLSLSLLDALEKKLS